MPERIAGGAALRVRTVIAGERAIEGEPALPVYYVQDSELKQNGGAYTLQGNQPVPIFEAAASAIVVGGAALPVYVTNPGGSSGPSLPDVASATRILDLQADAGVTTSTAAFSGSGVITQLGTTVSGVGTLFRSQVVVGDRITAIGIDGIVQSIASDTSLTLDTSAIVGIGVGYTIAPQAGTARVMEWTDQSTQGNDFAQSATARPSKQTLSGYPAIVFDGFNDWMLGPDFANDLASFTIFTVAKYNAAGGLTLIGKINDHASNPGWRVGDAGARFLVQQNGTNLETVVNDVAGRGLFKVRAGELVSLTEMHVYVNGSAAGEIDGGAGTVTTHSTTEPVRLGVTGAELAGLTFFSGEVRAVMIYSPAPNADDRAAIENWLAGRYGITL